MKKKGFTLIELLAVIVILAIIAVIATPIILGIVENTRKEAFQRSVELVEKATALNVNNKTYETNYTYTLTDGVISDDVAVTNTEGMNGTINYDKDGNVTYAIYNDKWCVVKGIETTIKDYEEGKCNLPGTIFRITYNLNDGTQGENAVEEFTVETETFSLPIPTKEQNTFLGWYTNQDFTGEAVTEIEKGTEGNKIFYAKWKLIEYTIIYNLNGGINPGNAVEKFTSETETFDLPMPSREEYVFEGWYTSSDFLEEKVLKIEKGTLENKTYYAKWIEETYVDGTPIYYDVLTGKRCISYHEDNSITGYNGVHEGDNSRKTTNNQNSCLKFYAFLYNEEDTLVKLLLDHNTTSTVYWTNAETTSNENGPIDVISQLKIDTSSWIGTEIPENYELTQGDINYTIEYNPDSIENDYKARLIKANEIAEIAGADGEDLNFDESTTSWENWFYFDSLSQAAKDECKSGNTTGCSYGWLYDRTSTSCIAYGCLNNATGSNISNMPGYWTSTSAFGSTNGAWDVRHDGTLETSNILNQNYGVRPVIEVLKSNL